MSSQSDQPNAGDRRDDERRQAKVPVEQDRRKADRRSGADRRSAPRVG